MRSTGPSRLCWRVSGCIAPHLMGIGGGRFRVDAHQHRSPVPGVVELVVAGYRCLRCRLRAAEQKPCWSSRRRASIRLSSWQRCTPASPSSEAQLRPSPQCCDPQHRLVVLWLRDLRAFSSTWRWQGRRAGSWRADRRVNFIGGESGKPGRLGSPGRAAMSRTAGLFMEAKLLRIFCSARMITGARSKGSRAIAASWRASARNQSGKGKPRGVGTSASWRAQGPRSCRQTPAIDCCVVPLNRQRSSSWVFCHRARRRNTVRKGGGQERSCHRIKVFFGSYGLSSPSLALGAQARGRGTP